jgi:hypothetical protein
MTKVMEIIIPNYIRRYVVSNKQRPQYWEWTGTTICTGKKQKPLLQKFLDFKKYSTEIDLKAIHPRWLKNDYQLVAVSGKKQKTLSPFVFHYTTIEFTRKRLEHQGWTKSQANKAKFYIGNANIFYEPDLVYANERTVGKQISKPINGQLLYSGMVGFDRHNMMTQIKESFLPYVQDLKPVEREDLPLRVALYLYDEVGNSRWDVGNRCYPYMKGMLDLLTTGETGKTDKDGNRIKYFEPILPDDDRLTICGESIDFEEQDIPNHSRLEFIFSQKTYETL